MGNSRKNWYCAQMGAREHYAIPRALHKLGRLGGLATDYWSGSYTRSLANAFPNKLINSLGARFHNEIPNELLHSWNLQAILWDAKIKLMTRTRGVTGRYLGYCEVGKQFGEAIIHSLDKHGGVIEESVFFGYDTCSLEVIKYLKNRGVVCVLDQIDPCQIEIEMVRDEQDAWPGWQSYDLTVPDEFYQRHHEEWSVADNIVVNSKFTCEALVKQGVSREKVSVVPLSYDPVIFTEQNKVIIRDELARLCINGFSPQRPLRVLFLGQVMLRKGIQYLMKAAELLQKYPVVFDIVGPIYISDKALATASKNINFHGRVARNDIAGWYKSSDLFILPTLSDGFAITQLEAMSYGLPVIVTANCGDVVDDGVDGFVLPVRDIDSIVRVICQYLEHPGILELQREAAFQKSKLFSLDRVGEELLSKQRNIISQSKLGGTCD